MDGKQDPLGILTDEPKKQVDPLGILKKKEEGQFPLLYKRQKVSSIPAISPLREEVKKEPEVFTQIKGAYRKPEFGEIEPEYTDEEAEKKAIESFSKGEHVALPDSKDPIKDLLQQIEVKKYSYPEYKVARSKSDILKNNYFQTGEQAKQYLQKDIIGKPIDNISVEELRQLSGDNVTKQIAVNRYENFKKVEDALNKANTIEEAAIYYAAEDDPNVRYLLRESGGVLGGFTEQTSAIPLAIRGEKKLQFLMNRDVQDKALTNPELRQQIKEEIYNFPINHPEYATKILAEFIAKRREEKGENNWFINIVGKENTDKILDELIEDGTLPFNYKFLYEREIRPKLGTGKSIGRGIGNAIPGINQMVSEGPIPTPGLMENIEQGLESTQVGIAKGIANLPKAIGMPGIQDLMQPEAQQTYNILRKQYETPSFEPTKLWHKATMHGGQLIPFVAGLAGGTSALKALSIVKNPALASATMMALSTHGETSDRSKVLFPGNDFKQFVYTSTMDVLNGAMGRFLPGQKIPSLLLKDGDKTISDILSKMVDGKITTDAAKSQIMQWFGNTAKGTLKGTLSGAEFMGAISAADDLLTQTLQQKNIDFSQTLEQTWEGFKLGLIATPFLAGAESALKSNKGFRDQIITVAENADYYKSLAEMEGKSNPEFAEIKDDVIRNIDYLSKVNKELEGYDLTPKEKQKQLLNSLSELIKTTKAQSATDPTIKKMLQKEAKDVSEVKEGVLKGLPEEKIKLNQAIRDIKELYNEGFLSKGASEMLESKKTEEGEAKFDENKVKQFLKFVAQQANNITEDGKFNIETDVRKSAKKSFPSQIIELANEMFPEYQKTAEEADVRSQIKSETIELEPTLPEGYEMPEKPILETEVTIPKSKTEEYAIPERKAEDIPLGQAPGDSRKVVEGTPEPKEPPPVQEEIKGEGEKEMIRLTHADTERIYQEAGLPFRLETPTKNREQLVKEADEQLKKGYDFDKIAEETMSGDYKFEDTDQFNFARKVADLKAKQKSIDINDPEFDNIQKQIENYSRAADVVGTLWGRLGRERQNYVPVEQTISDYVTREKEESGVNILTEKEKETVQKEFNEIDSAEKEYQNKVSELKEESTKKDAETEINKIRVGKKAKKTKEDFISERKGLKDKLKEAREEHEKWLKEQGIQKAGFGPSFTFKEAKIVGQIIKSYAEETALTLKEIASKVIEEIRDFYPDVNEKDIIDVAAGIYSEKRQTKNEAKARVISLQQEAKLINKLESIQKGEQPKSEKKKVEQNKAIKDLQDQLKPYTDLQSYKTKVKSEIEKIEQELKEDRLIEEKKTPKLILDKEAKDLRDKVIKLRQQRELRLLLKKRQNEKTREKALRLTAEVLNVPRTLMTIADFSALLRQNIFFSAGHPIMTARNVPDMLKSFTSQKVYDRWFNDLKETDRYEGMKQSRLSIADIMSHELSTHEEAFMSTVAEKIPIIGKSLEVKGVKIPGLDIVKGSERSYTMLLNKMRVDMYNFFAERLENRGWTIENKPKEYKAMAEYINNATGRSDFGEKLNRIAPILNSIFFSPRLIASRINMLTYWAQPRFWKTLPKEVRIDYMRNWVALLAEGGAILALAKFAGSDVEDDPRSSDFGKIKSGNTRWDIWGGAQPYIRIIAQMATGKRKSTTSGKIYDLDGDDIFGETRMGVVTDFFRNKLAPVPGMAVDILSGRTTVGDKIVYDWDTNEDKEISIRRYIQDRLLPMTFTGTAEAMKDQGVKALFTVLPPSLLGVGTQTYEPPKPKSKRATKRPSKRTSRINE